ncbi:MAG: hypothetical protein ACI4RM_00960 [Ruminococcus sp.]
MKKQLYKKLILSVVALILVSTMVVGVTYSWIESITAVEITNSGSAGADDSKQSIGGDIAETINIKNCGEEGSVIGKDGTTATNWADLGAFFNESGDMHLTTCSGNGDSFMFRSLKGSTGAKPWRIGTEDDENVNYISATFRINVSDEADVDFWFKQIPTVKKGDTALDVAYYSFTVDGETKVYTTNPPTGGEYSHINNADGGTTKVPVEKTAKYTFGDPSNKENPEDENDINVNTNVLFSIPKGATKDVTVRIWLQNTNDSDTYTGEKVNVDMQIVSTWAVTRRIRIFDGTSDKSTEHWIYNDGARMFLALSADTSKHWELDIDNNTHYGYADIPSYYYEGNEICIYRCQPGGPGDGFSYGNIEYNGVDCWNYWATTLPKGFKNETFNILGNTPYYEEIQSDIGYIYWGDVEHITVKDMIGLNHTVNEKVRMLVHDADTGFYYSLYPGFDGNSFSGYIPKSSDKIEFRYKDGGFELNRINSSSNASIADGDEKKNQCYSKETGYSTWGYNKDVADPQKRPLGATTYTILSNNEGTWNDLIETDYSLKGSFNDWSDSITFKKTSKDSELAYASINLTADKLYEIKVKDNADNYYSNNGVMCRSNSSNWTMKNSEAQNMGFITSEITGTYKFELNTTNMKLSAVYPGNGDGSRVYLVANSTNYDAWDKYAYMWKSDGRNNGNFPGQKMDWLGKLGDNDIYLLNYGDGWMPTNVKFSGYNENKTDDSNRKWKSIDLGFTGYQLYTNPDKEYQ